VDWYNTVVNFFKDGGFVLFPLGIIFVVGVAISLERWFFLTKETVKNRNLWDEVAPHLGAGNFKAAIQLANASSAQIGTVLKYGLARLSTARRRDDIQQAMEESLLEIVPQAREAHAVPVRAREHRHAHRSARHHPRADQRLRRRLVREPG
jgi:biopolymer transport protein ExbB